jgi:phosphonate transport system substrate-binding protein
MAKRRGFLKSLGVAGTAAVTGLAGCLGTGGGGDGGSRPSMTFGGDQRIDFNLSPSVPQSSLYVQYGPVRDYLESYFKDNYGEEIPDGLGANMNLGNNYAAVIQALGQGTADIAETGPFAAALGVKSDNAEVILQRKGYGSWTYVSMFSVAPDSDVSSLSDLEGEKVAFADRLSTSGALYPLHNLKTEGGLGIGDLPEGTGNDADFEPVFTGGHTESYAQLKQGGVAAAAHGGFVPGIVDSYDDNATELFVEEGLPRAPIVVSSELSTEVQDAMQQAFLDAPSSIYYGANGEEGGDDDLWFNDVREADVDTYQSVIDTADELGVTTDIFQS